MPNRDKLRRAIEAAYRALREIRLDMDDARIDEAQMAADDLQEQLARIVTATEQRSNEPSPGFYATQACANSGQ